MKGKNQSFPEIFSASEKANSYHLVTDLSENSTSSAQRRPCIACREPVHPEARICPHCGSHQRGGGWKFVGSTLKWVGAVTALISLIAGAVQLNGLLQSSRERSESVQRLVKAADMQIEYGDLDSAQQLIEQALALEPGSRAAGERQVAVAMMLLRRGFPYDFKYNKEEYRKKIDSLLSVLYRGAGDNDPVKAADALAHIGRANRMRRFNQNQELPIEEYFARAIALDSDNVFAHVFWAACCLSTDKSMGCNNNLQAAEEHFALAMRDGREQDYVRRQRFDRLRGSSVEGADILLIGDMIASWRDKIPLDEKQQQMIYNDISRFFTPYEVYGKKLQELVQRFPPADILAMLEWAGQGQKWEKRVPSGVELMALMAHLTELSNNRPLAIARYRTVRLQLRLEEGGGTSYGDITPIREWVDWALVRLLAIRPPAWIGLKYQKIDDELATSLGMPEARGLFISDVIPASPAETGGLAAGDVILEIEGRKATKRQILDQQMRTKFAGDTLALTILRKGEEKQLQLTLGELKAPADLSRLKKIRGTTQLALLMDQLFYQSVPLEVGEYTLCWIASLTDELRTGLQLDQDAAGVLVLDTPPPRREDWMSELYPGHLILAVNNHPVNSAEEVVALIEQARKAGEPFIYLTRLRLRDGKRKTVAARIN